MLLTQSAALCADARDAQYARAELDVLFDISCARGKLTFVEETDGSEHIKQISNKHAAVLLLCGKRYTIDTKNGALVVLRNRYAAKEDGRNLESRERSVLHGMCVPTSTD
jgi:hypothetical protein